VGSVTATSKERERERERERESIFGLVRNTVQL
jgi:hypothetical protein